MISRELAKFIKFHNSRKNHMNIVKRTATTTASGAILPKPERVSFGLGKTCIAVTVGILVGALFSKGMANFLEANELFVPSDEDDDD